MWRAAAFEAVPALQRADRSLVRPWHVCACLAHDGGDWAAMATAGSAYRHAL